MNSISVVSKYLNENAERIANDLLGFSLGKIDFEIPEEIIQRSRKVNADFILFLSEAITYNSDDEVAARFIEWSKKHSQKQATLLDKLSSLIKPFPETRLHYNKLLTTLSITHKLSVEDTVLINNRLNYMLDINLSEVILAYERYKNEINQKNKREIMEVSAPIVPIQDDIAVLPLIGSIDFDRAEHLMSSVVPQISELGIDYLIIDFSGIMTIDSEVAGHVFNITGVLSLLGIDVIITGLRPDLAKNVVESGINLTSLKTYSNVKQALESLG